jgi:hypothetical protein
MSYPTTFFSSRSWNGLLPAASAFVACAVVFDLLAWLAWHGDQGRSFDLLASAIGFPSVLIALLLAAAAAWSRVGHVPFTQALGWGIRLLPLAWVVPLIDFVRTTGFGVASIVPYANGWGLVSAILTGGIFPLSSGLPIGIRFGLIAGAFGVGIVAWHFSKHWIASILSALWFSVVGICATHAVSFAIFWNAPFDSASWTALPVDLIRRSSVVFNRGYWWDLLYDRFPTPIDGQIAISTRLLSMAGALLVVLVMLVVGFLYERKRRTLLRYAYGSWSAARYVSVIAIGLIFGYREYALGSSVAFLPAFAFMGFIIAALRLSSVLRRDMARLEWDERSGVHQPILDGTLTLEEARAISRIAEWSAVAAAWMLGWPVLLSLAVYLGCAKLSRDHLWLSFDQVATGFRVIGSAALAAMAFFFLTQGVHLTTPLLTAMGVSAAFCLLIEWFWMPKFRKIGIRDTKFGGTH